MANQYVVGVDVGTTGTKSVVFDIEGNIKGIGYFNTPTYWPRPGWSEQNANDVEELMLSSTKFAIQNSGVDPKDIIGVGFTHMCTTWVPVDKDGNYLHPIVLWNDTRGGEMFDFIRDCWAKNGITEKEDFDFTGYPLGGLTTLAKILWLKHNHPDIYEKTYKFCGMQALMTKAYTGEAYIDDKPGIGYSKLANCKTFEFDPFRAQMYDLDLDKYPVREDPGFKAGVVSKEAAEKTGLLPGTPVFIGAGDQRCAAVGAGVAKDGTCSVCLGTGGVIHAFSSKPKVHPEGRITLLGHAGTGKWQIEGSCSSAASSFEWYKDIFCTLEDSFANVVKGNVFVELTRLASQSPVGSRGVMYTAWLASADCPRFDVNARGTITGLTFSHTKADVTRAIMEGVCFEMMSMIEAAMECMDTVPTLARAVGGGSKSDFWNQIQADVYNMQIETVQCGESTALAAAMFAAIGAGVYKDVHEGIDAMVKVKNHYDPISANVEVYKELFELYKMTYEDMKTRVFPAQKKFQDAHFE